jgi:hypothetical protein
MFRAEVQPHLIDLMGGLINRIGMNGAARSTIGSLL